MKEDEMGFDDAIKNAKCIPGINYVSIDEDEENLIILEVYYKNENEYSIIEIGHASKLNDKMDELTRSVYNELKEQGLSEAGAKYISGYIIDQKTHDAFMEYLISVRDKEVSYTELWREKNRILKEIFGI